MIERISGLDDPRLAGYRHVGDARWLREHGLFVAEGRLVVRRLIEEPHISIGSILLTPAALAALDAAIGPAADRLDVFVCAQDELNALTGYNFHRGCLALAHRPAPTPLDALFGARRVVALEAVGDPDNVGSIFRNVLAFGAGGVIVDRRTADPLYRKAIRTSMAATLRVPFVEVEAWEAAARALRDRGFGIVAMTPSPDAADIAEAAPALASRPVVLLFGSEGAGLSEAALAGADARVRIPVDPRSDSLNVAVAAGIALHRFSR